MTLPLDDRGDAYRACILERLQQFGWSQTKLSDSCGIAVTNVNGMLKGRRSFGLDSFFKMAHALKYDVNNRLETLEDFGTSPRKISYQYDAAGDLTKVTKLYAETGLERRIPRSTRCPICIPDCRRRQALAASRRPRSWARPSGCGQSPQPAPAGPDRYELNMMTLRATSPRSRAAKASLTSERPTRWESRSSRLSFPLR